MFKKCLAIYVFLTLVFFVFAPLQANAQARKFCTCTETSATKNVASETECKNFCCADSKVRNYEYEEQTLGITTWITTKSSGGACPAATAPAATTAPPKPFITPQLNIPIPNLTFTQPTIEGGLVKVPFLSQYLGAIYNWAIAAGATFAALMIMIGGAQYIISSGTGDVSAAKKKITGAVIGFVLLLGSWVLLNTFNPNLTALKPLEIDYVAEKQLNLDTGGAEGTHGGGADTQKCKDALAAAKANARCTLSDGALTSPTGNDPSCNYHFQDKNYDYTKITSVDYIGSFGTEAKSPVNGEVKFVQGKGANRCGNRVYVYSSGTHVATLCHLKRFIDPSGSQAQPNVKIPVQKGQVIGEIGGRGCSGLGPPKANQCKDPKNALCWSQYDKFTYSGTPCTDPFDTTQSCDCQDYKQAGNTSGGHVHISWKKTEPLLACIAG